MLTFLAWIFQVPLRTGYCFFILVQILHLFPKIRAHERLKKAMLVNISQQLFFILWFLFCTRSETITEWSVFCIGCTSASHRNLNSASVKVFPWINTIWLYFVKNRFFLPLIGIMFHQNKVLSWHLTLRLHYCIFLSLLEFRNYR